MKTIYDLVFCEDVLNADVVWYSVRVGVSGVDHRANKFVRNIMHNDSRFFYFRHSLQVSEFKQRVADSLFSSAKSDNRVSVLLLRHRTIEVVELARFLRRCPPALLNSEKMAEAISEREITLSGMATAAAVQLRKFQAAKRL